MIINGYNLNGSDNDRIQEFFYNIGNEYNCNNCPFAGIVENLSVNQLPCGQYHCWVTIHNMEA